MFDVVSLSPPLFAKQKGEEKGRGENEEENYPTKLKQIPASHGVRPTVSLW